MKRIILFYLLLSEVATFAQQPEINLPQIAPSSPETAALGKFINTPVSYFTGVPQIQIPIYQLQDGNINVPVSLAYHSGGIRVNEMATRVGLGWKLDAGGSVTRMVRGLPDDSPNGYINTSVSVSDLYSNSTQLFSHLESVMNQNLDLESDIYHFNLPDGTSGKFFFNQNGQIFTIPANSNVKIQYVQDASNYIKQWIITSSNGITFYLGQSSDSSREAYEKSSSSVWASLNGSGAFSFPDPSVHLNNYITTWHLMQINDFANNQIDISYEAESIINYVSLGSQSKILPTYNNTGCISLPTHSYSFTESTTRVRRISSITSNNGTIDFVYEHNRLDLINDKALTAIVIKDQLGSTIKTFALSYDYFQSNQNSNLVYGNLDQRRKRLYLRHIIENPTAADEKKTAFEYHTAILLPDRFSYAQDFWGYYNGRHSNNSLIPTVEYQPTIIANGDLWIGFIQNTGADRKVYEDYAKACSLKKVIYPTKGSTTYEFESNTVYDGNDFFAGTQYHKEVIVTQHTFDDDNEIITIPFTIDTNNDSFNYPVHGIVEYSLKMYDHTGAEIPVCTTNGFDCPQVTIEGNRITNASGAMKFNDGDYSIRIDNYSDTFNPGQKIDVKITLSGRSLMDPASPNAAFGGLRIASIIQRDADNEVIVKKQYDYHNFINTSQSSGKALHPPIFINFDAPVCSDRANRKGTLVYSRPILPLDNERGFNAGYTNVTESFEGSENGKTEYTFFWAALGAPGEEIHHYQYVLQNSGSDPIIAPTNSEEVPQAPYRDLGYTRGLLLQKSDYIKEEAAFTIVQKVTTQYFHDYNNDVVSFENLIANKMGNYLFYRKYKNYSGSYLLQKNTTTSYYYNEANAREVVTEQHYAYGSHPTHYFATMTDASNSNAASLITKTYYPDDVASISGLTFSEEQTIGKLNQHNQHRIAMPIQMETYEDYNNNGIPESNELLSKQLTVYKDFDPLSADLIFPEKIRSAKGSNDLQDRIQYHDYDDSGNLLEVSKADGSHSIYIWGYKDQYPIAKIDNATYTGMPPDVTTLISQIRTASDTEDSEVAENMMRGLFNDLRDHTYFRESAITSYTFDPLVGVTSITDPRGYTVTYYYDVFNRLEFVKDQDGNLISENKYNYKTE